MDAKSTTRMAAIDLHALRTASGTRRAVSEADLERHIRAKADSAIDADAHSRPTITGPAPIIVAAASVDEHAKNEVAPPIAPWVVACILFGLTFLMSAAGTVGFFLGRYSR